MHEDASFRLDASGQEALDRAARYLEAAGNVAPSLRGRLERLDGRLVVHHGAVRTSIRAVDRDGGCHVAISRQGHAPFERTRGALVTCGLVAALVAWGLAVLRQERSPFAPLVTMTLFFLGLVALMVVLYVVDRSLEARSRSLMESLEDAMREDPMTVLRGEISAYARAAAVAAAFLFLFSAIVVEFVVFWVLFSDGIRQAIDEAVTTELMRVGVLLPIVPAAVFGWIVYVSLSRAHERRMAAVQ